MSGPSNALNPVLAGVIVRKPKLADLGATLRRAFAAAAEWRARMRERRALAAMDDRLLRDIGLSRSDVWSESSKPFWRA